MRYWTKVLDYFDGYYYVVIMDNRWKENDLRQVMIGGGVTYPTGGTYMMDLCDMVPVEVLG